MDLWKCFHMHWPGMFFFQTLARLCFPSISHCIYENSVFTTGKNSKQLRTVDWHAVSLGINFVWTISMLIFLIESDVKMSLRIKIESSSDSLTCIIPHPCRVIKTLCSEHHLQLWSVDKVFISFSISTPAQYEPCAATSYPVHPIRWLCTLKIVLWKKN